MQRELMGCPETFSEEERWRGDGGMGQGEVYAPLAKAPLKVKRALKEKQEEAVTHNSDEAAVEEVRQLEVRLAPPDGQELMGCLATLAGS